MHFTVLSHHDAVCSTKLRHRTRCDIHVVVLQAGGSKKRKASSYDEGDAAIDMLALPSKKRLFQRNVESAASMERRNSSHLQQDAVYGVEQAEAADLMEVDVLEERLSGIVDPEMGSAIAGLLCMRRSSSSELSNFAT